MNRIKKVAISVFIFIMVCIVSLHILHTADCASIHQDIYNHYHWNSQGQFLHNSTEKIGASDEDATIRATYLVFHILDADGQNHTLWVSHKYEEKDSTGNWVETDSGSVSILVIIAFFLQHMLND